jgi:branched-chain amino acid transport system substrate-binding protein
VHLKTNNPFRPVVALSLAAAMLSMSACGGSSAADDGPETVKIGMIAPLTGNLASAGEYMVQGAKLAVEQINKEKLAGDHKLELVIEDDEGVPKNAVAAANKLVSQDEVQAVVGPFMSSGVLASMEVTRDSQIPQFAPVASAPGITEQGNEYVFRMNASDLGQARGVTEYAVEEAGVEKVAVLYQNDDYGTQALPVIRETAEDSGADVVAEVAIAPGGTDFSSEVLKAKEAGADGLIVWSYYAEASVVAQAAKRLAYQPQLFGGGASMYPQLIELGGESVEGFVSVTPYAITEETEKQKAFLESYRAAYDADPDPSVAMTFDILMLIAAAVEEGNVTGPDIREYVSQIKDFEGVTATFSAMPNGDMDRGFVFVQVQDGKWVPLAG